MSSTYYDESYPPTLWAAADLGSLNPSSVVVDTPTPVTVTGTGFTPSSRVYCDGDYYPTDYISPTQVRFIAQAISVGSQDVYVRNGYTDSDMLVLTVTATADEPEPQQQPATEYQAPPEPPVVPQEAPEPSQGTQTAQEPPEAP